MPPQFVVDSEVKARHNDVMSATLRSTVLKLIAYCRAEGWAGYDPYDALNSSVLTALPFLNFRLSRLALTQLLKRSAFNIRPYVFIPKTENPKAIALFLRAVLLVSGKEMDDRDHLRQWMVDRLINLQSPVDRYCCWGYSFPWQTRTILVPRGAPNLVCTTFVADTLLDNYEQCHDWRSLEMASRAAHYL